MYAVEGHTPATGARRKVVWRKAAAWLCLLVLLCAATRVWQIVSDSMLVGPVDAAHMDFRAAAEGQTDRSNAASVPVLCVRRAEVDVYTAALMDRHQLREFEASLCL